MDRFRATTVCCGLLRWLVTVERSGAAAAVDDELVGRELAVVGVLEGVLDRVQVPHEEGNQVGIADVAGCDP